MGSCFRRPAGRSERVWYNPTAFRDYQDDERVTRWGVVLGCALALLPALSSLAHAEVKTRVRPDGSLEVYNDGPGLTLGRPLQLRPVPQPTWAEWIRVHAAANGLDPRLVQALMQAESAYDPRAVSLKGAIGLMQLMPATARELAVPDPFNPEQNIRGGVTYLRRMLDLFGGQVDLALAAYNAGPGAVQRHRGVPPYAETRHYVQHVLTLYRGGAVFVGIRAAGGPTRPHGLAGSAVPSPLQRALASGGVRPRDASPGSGAGGSAVVATRSPRAAPALSPSRAVAAVVEGEPPTAVAALVAGGG
jgi:hypothetical protein